MAKFNIHTLGGFLRRAGRSLKHASPGRMVAGLGLMAAMLSMPLFQIRSVGFESWFQSRRGIHHRPRGHHPAAATATATPGAPPKECELPDQYVKLSKCIGSDANKTVVIGGNNGTGDCQGNNVKAYVDQALLSTGLITINAGSSLTVADRTAQLPVRLETLGIDDFGTLEIGNAACPIGTINPNTSVTVVFKGDVPGPNNPVCKASPCPGYTKGIQVESKGTLRMYGAKGVPRDAASAQLSWTYLRDAAGPATGFAATDGVKAPVPAGGNLTLKLAYDVSPATNGKSGWRKDDWIAVAGTSFSPWETEFVQLASDAQKDPKGGSIVTIKPGVNGNGLQYYHFGGADPGPPSSSNYTADSTTNYGIDERAEVGLISRSIKLTSDAPLSGAANHWGGETRFLKGFTEVSVQGVEFEKFGKQQLGSYPIHFHMDGDVSGSTVLVNANSIHHSYDKCVTVHSSSNLTIQNNVCARITGHIFYQEMGDEYNVTYTRNVGMSAMSNSFDVNAADAKTRCDLINAYYWKGDNLAPGVDGCRSAKPDIGFDQFRIFDTGDQTLPVHGVCMKFSYDGGLIGTLSTEPQIPNCTPPFVYFEAPSGFWITNPSSKIIGNSIAGCQDTGRAYYYVPPGGAVAGVETKWIPIGTRYSGYGANKYGVFKNDRGHGCYSGIYDEPENTVSDSLFGYENAAHDNKHDAVADEFENLTLSRIRDRGIWVRPSFYVADSARVSTTRDAVSLVTSGGVDGNYPGVWGLLSNSVVVGMSQNNVDRWGPCPTKVIGTPPVAQVRGGDWGCIDKTNPNNPGSCAQGGPTCNPVTGAEFLERGYDTPDWPMFGFLIYDGPPLIIHDRFVNFKVAPGSTTPDATNFPAANFLTKADDTVLKGWPFYAIPNQPPYKAYEGDAALGWFNANQSSYPAATTTDQLTFDNVDLRHQVYTAAVNRGDFTDGDQNTTILDLDGTLAGVTAIDSAKNKLPSISLNNLPINASSNSVDECHATGSQDADLEGRPTAAMAPDALGQLEFEMLYPNYTAFNAFKHTETLTFAKNTTDYSTLFPNGYHGTMALKSRDGKGDWEPKVTNGYGYTVTASQYTSPAGAIAPPVGTNCPPTEQPCSLPGIGGAIDLTLTDIVNAPNITSNNPFYVQLGICFTNADNTHPANGFTITKGFRSYGGGNVVTSPGVSDALKEFWTGLLPCNNIDFILTGGDDKKSNILPPTCPSVSGSSPSSPITTLNPVTSIKKMYVDANNDGNPPLNGKPILNNYFYDASNGWLFLWVAQTEPNAHGQSPLGNCKGTASDPPYCPKTTTGESYYVCPAEGCPSYRIIVNDSNYKPGPSACGDPYSAAQGYSWPGPPANENTLVLAGSSTAVVRSDAGGKNNKFPHYVAKTPLTCN